MNKLFFSILLSIQFLSHGQPSNQIPSHGQTSIHMPMPSKDIYMIPYWGTILGGYVDQGAYVNFTGPSLGYSFGKSQILIGMLPSLRFKKDTGTIKNSMVTPSLGFGITYTFKSLAFQVPIYYTNKTSTTNGHWNLGVGLGLKLSAIRFKKD